MITCVETGSRIDAFVDGELSPTESVDVARHLAQCGAGDRTASRLLTLRDVVVAETERAVDALDLSGVWTRVEGAIDRAKAQGDWRERVAARRRIPRPAVWGGIAAIAASAALFLRTPAPPPAPAQIAKSEPAAAQPARTAKRLPNHVYIDRLAGKDIAVRREPKSGTTMIWVHHEVESNGW